MWLLDTWSIDIQWVGSPKDERYAILSHVWNRDKEERERWERLWEEHEERYGITQRRRKWIRTVEDREEEKTFQDVNRVHKSLGKRVARTVSGRGQSSSKARSRGAPSGINTPAESGPSPYWSDPRFSQKSRDFCSFAHANGYRYAWIDACCIDRTNSTELNEAINSMYEWYAQAAVCYVYLRDVLTLDDPGIVMSAFRRSVWFTRSWTLQELLAPKEVVFLNSKWQVLGTKTSLATLIEEITGIPPHIILNEAPLDSVSVARRMSWASTRRAALIEDEAYSLMGIFHVSMPIAYGEGKHAFFRLQQQILTSTSEPDYSIFAWGSVLEWENITYGRWQSVPDAATQERTMSQLFADSPAAFKDWATNPGRSASPITWQALAERLGLPDTSHLDGTPLKMTRHGIHLRIPLLAFRVYDRMRKISRAIYLGFLPCEDEEDRLMTLVLARVGDRKAREFSVDLLWQFMTYRRNCRVRVLGLPGSAINHQLGNIPVYDVHILQTAKRNPVD